MKKQFKCCSITYEVFIDREDQNPICLQCRKYMKEIKIVHVDYEENIRSIPYNYLDMKERIGKKGKKHDNKKRNRTDALE